MRRGTVRLGAYGDPAMVPEEVMAEAVRPYKNWLGYSHQWRMPWAQWARRYCMASVDSAEEQAEAAAAGWRTFRVAYGGEPVEGEIVCPNTTHGVQCERCLLCDGAREGDKRKSIVVTAHGSKSRKHLTMEV